MQLCVIGGSRFAGGDSLVDEEHGLQEHGVQVYIVGEPLLQEVHESSQEDALLPQTGGGGLSWSLVLAGVGIDLIRMVSNTTVTTVLL